MELSSGSPPTNIRDGNQASNRQHPTLTPSLLQTRSCDAYRYPLVSEGQPLMVVQDSCDKDGRGPLRGSQPEGCVPGGVPGAFQWSYIDGWNVVRLVRDSQGLSRVWGGGRWVRGPITEWTQLGVTGW